jgi:transcriptional regulator with XRE-family HTH domain
MAEQDGEAPFGSRSPTAPRMILGSQLRRFREAAGMTPDDAGYRIRASRSKISRMENGRVGFKERDVADLLTLYGVADSELRSSVLSLVGLAGAAGWWSGYDEVLPGWFEPYLGLESAASLIRCFELQFVPGLFQHEDYARGVVLLGPAAVPGEETDRRVALRLKRQDLLTRPDPPRIWAVVDEGVLRRPIGGRSTMRAQLTRLTEVADLPNVTLQVMPFGRGGHAAAGGSFSMLRFDEAEVPDMVYIEQLASAVYLDKREDVDLYAGVMDRLGAKALTPPQTLTFLAKIRDET